MKTIRVLHTLGTFLKVSENWIYPQILGVTGVDGRVLCSSVANHETFPLNTKTLIVDPPSRDHFFGIPRLINSAARRLGQPSASAALRIALWRPHAVHAHFGMRGWESLNLKRRLGVPLITSFYGYDAWKLPESQPFWRQRYADLFAIGDVFLVEGAAMRGRLIELGCAPEKVMIQRIGVDVSTLSYEKKDFARLRVVMVARFVEKKGLVDGLRACALARSRGADLTVTIIGDATDPTGQRIKTELQEIAGSPELIGLVKFAGFLPLDETRRLISQHNVFLSPSKHAANGDAEGGSPVALTEAMGLGLLCIGTRHCDIPEVINQRTGYLCNESDVAGMSQVLSDVARVPRRLEELTRAGRIHVEEHFSQATQLKRARWNYESLLNASGPMECDSLEGVRREISVPITHSVV